MRHTNKVRQEPNRTSVPYIYFSTPLSGYSRLAENTYAECNTHDEVAGVEPSDSIAERAGANQQLPNRSKYKAGSETKCDTDSSTFPIDSTTICVGHRRNSLLAHQIGVNCRVSGVAFGI